MAPVALSEEAAAKILRQVEFYFSDSNLPRDKFLLQSINSSDDGLVSLPVVCSFSRMRSHLGLKEHGMEVVTPGITQAVAEVLRKSAVLRVSEDGLKVGRADSLEKPELVQAQVDARTVAAGPLPYDTDLEQVENFFGSLGKVNSVRLPRRANSKVFGGVALVEFSSEDCAKKVLEMQLEHQGVELELETKAAFDERARQQIAEHEEKLEKEGEEPDYDYPFPEGLIIAFHLKKLGEGENVAGSTGGDDQEPPLTEAEPATVPAVDAGEAEEGEATDEAAAAPGEGKQEEGTPAESKGKKDENALYREDIKLVMSKYGTVKFVDFSLGAISGYIRFEAAEECQKARAAAAIADEGGFSIKGHLMTVEAVEGDAEKEYWKKLRAGQGRRRMNGGRGDSSRQWHRGGLSGRSGGSRGRGGGRGGYQGRDDRQGNGFGGKKGSHKRFRDDEGHDSAAAGNGAKKAASGVVFE